MNELEKLKDALDDAKILKIYAEIDLADSRTRYRKFLIDAQDEDLSKVLFTDTKDYLEQAKRMSDDYYAAYNRWASADTAFVKANQAYELAWVYALVLLRNASCTLDESGFVVS